MRMALGCLPDGCQLEKLSTSAVKATANKKDLRMRALDVLPKSTIKSAESEKITINVGLIDLGQIDLLVQEGFYSNRTDLIRTAIRNQIAVHADVVRQTVARKSLVLGLHHYSRADLEAAQSAGQKLQIQILGLATIANDVSAELARAAIASIVVLGALHASAEVKQALADRIQ